MPHIDYSQTIQEKFQSLFSWNLLLMKNTTDDVNPTLEFQSLFSWNLLLMELEDALVEERAKFQSLFSWNLLLMSSIWMAPGPRLPSFNPCFRGTCSWWVVARLGYCHQVRFNPCFRGTCSWWTLTTTGTRPMSEVSILVFVELALDAAKSSRST